MILSDKAPIYLAALLLLVPLSLTQGDRWPQWRGPDGDGVSREQEVPERWSEQANVLWKCGLPGAGASTPAVWDNAIFVTGQQGERLLLSRIDKTSGRIEWTREVGTGVPARVPLKAKTGEQRRHQKFHQLHNMASPSPVTDGEVVIVHFGNGVLAAYDFAGRKLWLQDLQKDHGAYTIWWGHANSPVLWKDLVLSVCMQDSLADLPGERTESYVVAHAKRTGKQQWKTLRMTGASAEQCDSYTTPLLRKTEDGTELVVMGGNQLDAYDPATGRQLWYLPGIVGGRTITGPTSARGLIFTTQGQCGPLLAVRPAGTGRLPPSAIVWNQTQGTPDTSCPVVWQDLLFWVSDNGFAQCHDTQTGELKWKERLRGDYKASPLAAAGRIYFLNLKGLCTVVQAAPQFKKLAENQLDDDTIASPAVSDGRLYLRGGKTLYCIGTH